MARKRREKTTPERLQELRQMRYQEYLRQPEWYAKRAILAKVAGGRCQICNTSQGPFNAHHRRYRDERGQSILGAEKLSDLLWICQPCHELFHKNRRLARQDETA